MLSLFSLFVVELLAFRWGTARLARLGITKGPFQQVVLPDKIHSITPTECDTTADHHHVHREKGDEESSSVSNTGPDSAFAQVIGIAILEFGVVLHSILIGLTLAVNENFIILFIVVIFHRQ